MVVYYLRFFSLVVGRVTCFLLVRVFFVLSCIVGCVLLVRCMLLVSGCCVLVGCLLLVVSSCVCCLFVVVL